MLDMMFQGLAGYAGPKGTFGEIGPTGSRVSMVVIKI